jgi:hypothetical protein
VSTVLELHKAGVLLLLGAKEDVLDFGKFLRFTFGTNVEALFPADSNARVETVVGI